MPAIKKVYLHPVWNGGVEIRAETQEGEILLVEHPDTLLVLLAGAINEHGYTAERAPQQKYKRLVLKEK